ncbi:ist1 [Anaeramoeba flamelloides]|uniref:Ist1 n=1 Tax=Anaeramoeba flamelloides TaxID=1746091 RepID=A0ABQ8Z5X9_9EUKA|nr:ist1 [Anaeramoeba flamelloides]
MGKKFKPTECKVTLRLAIKRIKLLRQKKENNVKLQRRQIATLLSNGKDRSARIKVEQVIRDDFLVDAYEMLELLCDLLLVRFQVLKSEKTCTEDILESVATIIYVSKKIEVKELQQLARTHFVLKYGKEFVMKHLENKEKKVHEKIISSLGIMIPEVHLVLQYLIEIAENNDIEWDPEIALPELVKEIDGKTVVNTNEEEIQNNNFNQNQMFNQMQMMNQQQMNISGQFGMQNMENNLNNNIIQQQQQMNQQLSQQLNQQLNNSQDNFLQTRIDQLQKIDSESDSDSDSSDSDGGGTKPLLKKKPKKSQIDDLDELSKRLDALNKK